jgi:hypothetical protein
MFDYLGPSALHVPQRRICFFFFAWRAIVQELIPHRAESASNQTWVAHVYPHPLVMYMCACGCISVCMWPGAHTVPMNPCGCASSCMWPCIHMQNLVMAMGHNAEFGYALWATVPDN